MESTSFISSLLLPRSISTAASIRHKRSAIPTKLLAAKGDCSGRIVDASMIVLRKRIHQMKMIERNYERPAEWMDWEKRYYKSYDSIICDIMGAMQSRLMNTRPSVALGILAVVVVQLAEVSKGILAGINAVL